MWWKFFKWERMILGRNMYRLLIKITMITEEQILKSIIYIQKIMQLHLYGMRSDYSVKLPLVEGSIKKYQRKEHFTLVCQDTKVERKVLY
jgi:hypothetical protein